MSKQLRKLVILASILIIIGACIYYYFLFTPELVWDKSPNTLVIYTEVGPRHIDYNYIPDFRLWGDGRVIWVKHFPDGKRKVFEGFLSEIEILSVLEKFKDAGFFATHLHFIQNKDPFCSYQGFEDASITIDLVRHRNDEDVRTKDRKICDAINDLVTGTGIVGQEYIPAKGKIYFAPIEETDLPLDMNEVYQWADADFSFRPETIVSSRKNGKVVQGKEFQLAWEIVNRSSQPVVASNGEKFWMAVTIEGISRVY